MKFIIIILVKFVNSSETIIVLEIQWLIGAILLISSFSNLVVAEDAENEEALRAVSNGMNQFSTEFYKVNK